MIPIPKREQYENKLMKKTFLTFIITCVALAVGCGSGGGKNPIKIGGQNLVGLQRQLEEVVHGHAPRAL